MFYRSTPRRRGKAEDSKFDSPFVELSHNLDRLEHLANKAHKANAELHRPVPETPAPKQRRKPFSDSLKKLRRKSGEPYEGEIDMPSVSVTPTSERPPKSIFRKEPDADFVSVDSEDETDMIECMRRVSELVVIGERSAAAAADENTEIVDHSIQRSTRQFENEKYVALFEQFFERNGLALIVGIATGACFSLSSGQGMNNSYSSDVVSAQSEVDENGHMFLPPLSIATQALQSISILVQNVSRATSLYFILSNNHINQLIHFPLENYQAAERKVHNRQPVSPRRHGSSELAELTTHFITFLKSLALRMNVETLQFFLTYPPDENLRDQPSEISGTDVQSDLANGVEFDSVDEVPVNFPLYARALEFCSAHQDTFVRLTAMNICLNTLRLAAVSVDSTQSGEQQTATNAASPDGVLHNAKALPIRERLAIAQHVCAPSRVELLVSPIFTKLAQLWGMLEEQFRELDLLKSPEKNSLHDGAAARRQMLNRRFNDLAASLQDELLLFEDVLKVGLTSLNEQSIEMMLATFVYPLLLQPILLYFQRSQVSEETLFMDYLDNYLSGANLELPENEKAFISAPAKSALFSLSTIFLFITHQPLLRLLFGALFHPLAPNVIGETVIRSRADVAFINGGDTIIRIDPAFEKEDQENYKFELNYLFGVRSGTTPVPAKDASFSLKNDMDEDMCIFVLSPALAEILRADSTSQGDLLGRTRLNPYRKAILQCLTLSHEVSDLSPLAALTIDATVSVFGTDFMSRTLFGAQLPDLVENSLGLSPTSFVDEVVGAFLRCVATVVRGEHGWYYKALIYSWDMQFAHPIVRLLAGTSVLQFDKIAAHALLCTIQGNDVATSNACVKSRERLCQAAAFLSDLPSKLKKLDSNGTRVLSEADCQNNFVMDHMFRGQETNGLSVVEELKILKPEHRASEGPIHNIAVSQRSSFDELCRRASMGISKGYSTTSDIIGGAILSAHSWTRLDAYSNLISIVAANQLGTKLTGTAIRSDGKSVPTKDPLVIYSPISSRCDSVLFDAVTEESDPLPGTVLELVGHTAVPCVCEAPSSCASLFSAEGARVISDGVTWQSLYLVMFGQYMILAEPERSTSGGDGRVVTCCLLERLNVERDDAPHGETESCARRLLISYEGTAGSETPGLFLSNEEMENTKEEPFFPPEQFFSSLDCWFEDDLAATHAFDVLERRIKMSREKRGKRISDYILQIKGDK